MVTEGMVGFPRRKVFFNQKGGRMKNKQAAGLKIMNGTEAQKSTSWYGRKIYEPSVSTGTLDLCARKSC